MINELKNEDGINIPSSRIGIPRKKMPQILSTDVQDFLGWVTDQSIKWKKSKKSVSSLHITQKEINADKVVGMINGAKESSLAKPIIISKDNYIVDGHHRFVALLNKDNKYKIETYQVDLPIRELLKLIDKYPKTFYKTISESSVLDFLSFIKRGQ